MSAAGQAAHWSAGHWQGTQRWEAWRDALDLTHLPWALEPRSAPERYRAGLRWRQAAGASLVACRCLPCAGSRRAAEIRRSAEECFGLLYVVEGRERVRQGELSLRLGAGDLLLWDSTQPLDFEVEQPLGKITLLLPKAELAPLLPGGRRAAPLLLPRGRPEAALLAGYLKSLARVMAGQDEAAWQRAAAIAVELLVSAATAERPPPPAGRAEALRQAVEAEIRRRARDPALSPEWLAARQGVSARYLHKLFEARPYSLAELIRAERLEGARRELMAAQGRGVTEVAYGWGFQSPAHFSRSFKRRFGCRPSDLRRGGAN